MQKLVRIEALVIAVQLDRRETDSAADAGKAAGKALDEAWPWGYQSREEK